MTSKPPSGTVDNAAPGRGAKRLSLTQFFAYGGGDTANNLVFSLAISFLALYYTDVALISTATVGTIFLVMRVVDSFTDIIVGSIIDRTKTRFGKFRPYILAASIPLVISAVLAFSIPQSMYGTSGAVVWAVVTYFIMGSVFFTLVNIPYGSLAAAMTDNSDERAKLALFRSVGAAIMQVTVAVAISPLIEAHKGDPEALQQSLTRTIMILGVVAIALYAFLFFTARENVERKVAKVSLMDGVRNLKENKALQALGITSVVYLAGLFTLTGVLVYYTRDVLGNANYMVTFSVLLYGLIIVASPFMPRLIRQFGKPRLFQICALSGVIGGIIFLVAPGGTMWVAVFGALFIGLSSGPVNALMWNLEADTIEYGEWKTGMRTEGTTYAIFSFVRKLSQALGGAFAVWIIGWFGYDGAAEIQSDTALTGIRITASVVPAALFLISIILMQFYPLSDARHKEILAELAARKGQDNVRPDSPAATVGPSPTAASTVTPVVDREEDTPK